MVLLSTTPTRYATNDKILEITMEEPALEVGLGNCVKLKVAQSINEKASEILNAPPPEEAVQPCGSTKSIFIINGTGEKQLKESHFARLDEACLPWKNGKPVVRWSRDLECIHSGPSDVILSYSDRYQIGRDSRGYTIEHANVHTNVQIKSGKIERMYIEIGLRGDPSETILYEDEQLKIVEHPPLGIPTFATQMQIIQMDPNYTFLFSKPIDSAQVLKFMQGRINMLVLDWDQPQSIFQNGQSLPPTSSAHPTHFPILLKFE